MSRAPTLSRWDELVAASAKYGMRYTKAAGAAAAARPSSSSSGLGALLSSGTAGRPVANAVSSRGGLDAALRY